MRKLLAVVALLACTSQAFTEGIGRPYQARVQVDNPHSWYIGGLAGYHWANLEEGRYEGSDQGAAFGAYIAYLYRLTPRTSVGWEADIMWTDLQSQQCKYQYCRGAEQDMLYTARAKLGFHINEPVMAYVTGGAAWSDEQGTGGVIGGGLEAVLVGNVTGRVEALHYFLDSEQTVLRAGLGLKF